MVYSRREDETEVFMVSMWHNHGAVRQSQLLVALKGELHLPFANPFGQSWTKAFNSGYKHGQVLWLEENMNDKFLPIATDDYLITPGLKTG